MSKGLSTRFPERVVSTPISEAALIGYANGWALGGGKAAAEIMFGDFATLAADQLINQAAKMHFMYGGKVSVPTTVRMVSGGYRGYGPTHSQSLEGMFCGIPGLKVVALSRRHAADILLGAALLRDPNPVLFVENKSLYALRPLGGAPAGFRFVSGKPADAGHYPSLHFTSAERGDSADVTLVTYGGLTDIVEEAIAQLTVEEELEIDYFIVTQLSPLGVRDVAESARATGKLVVVEEGPRAFGVGSEVVSQVLPAVGGHLQAIVVASHDVPIPNSRVQEREVLPSRDRIVQAVVGRFTGGSV